MDGANVIHPPLWLLLGQKL